MMNLTTYQTWSRKKTKCVLTASSRAYHHRPQRRQQLVRPNSSQPIGVSLPLSHFIPPSSSSLHTSLNGKLEQRNVLLEASITKEQINLSGDFPDWKQKQENPIIFIKKKLKLEYRPSDSGKRVCVFAYVLLRIQMMLLMISSTEIEVLPDYKLLTIGETKDKKVEDMTGNQKRFLKKGVKEVLVKLGGRGSALFTEGKEPIIQSIIEAKKVIDTTGVGDTFTAAYVVAFVEGKSKVECLKFAAASLCVQVKGVIPTMPRKKAVLDLLQSI
ncbi:hypothetical protein L2E82_13021 [Cichorium intybus]|uniref:Uncharacterized protein n=1 Tax=Cichorium intybus TaxID=13427 RepID=A0ACB9GIW3_CICIN|nr:hypothetical protein L2E82_13021 [Cichorium intybus]